MRAPNALNLMEASTYTLDDQVDIVLHKIALAPHLTLGVNELYDVIVMNENAYLLDHFMLEKGLLKLTKEGRTITGKGLEISNFGGWVAYQRQLKKENPRNVFVADALQRRHEKDVQRLRSELAQCKLELESKAEKEVASSGIIKSLIEQNRSNRLMMFMGGIVTGLVLSSILWYFIF
jgi:hypothetical protein